MTSKRKLCDHCNEFVSLRTYRQHVDLYFNKSSKKWLKCDYHYESSGSDIDDHHLGDGGHVAAAFGSDPTQCDSGASHSNSNANDTVQINSQLRKCFQIFSNNMQIFSIGLIQGHFI